VDQVAQTVELSKAGTIEDRLWLAAELMSPPLFFSSYRFWVVDANGHIRASTVPEPLPFRWTRESAPLGPYGVHEQGHLRAGGSATVIVQMQTRPAEYLVGNVRSPDSLVEYSLFYLKPALPVIVGASLLASFLIIAYLRRKARVAAAVLDQLKAGNLAVRLP